MNIEFCPTINSTLEVVHAGLPLSKFAKNEPSLDIYLTQPPVTTVAMISNSGDSSGYYGYTAHIICNHDGVTFGDIALALRKHSPHASCSDSVGSFWYHEFPLT